MTKKISTPTHPPRRNGTPAWEPTTASTATARSPSMSARYASVGHVVNGGSPPSSLPQGFLQARERLGPRLSQEGSRAGHAQVVFIPEVGEAVLLHRAGDPIA